MAEVADDGADGGVGDEAPGEVARRVAPGGGTEARRRASTRPRRAGRTWRRSGRCRARPSRAPSAPRARGSRRAPFQRGGRARRARGRGRPRALPPPPGPGKALTRSELASVSSEAMSMLRPGPHGRERARRGERRGTRGCRWSTATEVLPADGHRAAREREGPGDEREVLPEQGDLRHAAREAGAALHGEAGAHRGQRGRVVEAVADHRRAACRARRAPRASPRGESAACASTPSGPGDGARAGLGVAGEHERADAHARSAATAAGASGRSASPMAKRASTRRRARAPRGLRAASAPSRPTATPCSRSQRAEPSSTRRPSASRASTPRPGTSARVAERRRRPTPAPSAERAARPGGGSRPPAPRRARATSRAVRARRRRSAPSTARSGRVSVPVLSNATVVTEASSSSAAALRTQTPFSSALRSASQSTSGVATP